MVRKDPPIAPRRTRAYPERRWRLDREIPSGRPPERAAVTPRRALRRRVSRPARRGRGEHPAPRAGPRRDRRVRRRPRPATSGRRRGQPGRSRRRRRTPTTWPPAGGSGQRHCSSRRGGDASSPRASTASNSAAETVVSASTPAPSTSRVTSTFHGRRAQSAVRAPAVRSRTTAAGSSRVSRVRKTRRPRPRAARARSSFTPPKEPDAAPPVEPGAAPPVPAIWELWLAQTRTAST